MADIRCPSCGKDNPDFLDLCQFCQTPLKPESMVHTGESPTKKDTGELEPILPEWLRNLRQQARKSAEENAAQEAAQPKVQKDEAPDLLAGLASQANAESDEIPDWLASISPLREAKPSEIPSPQAGTDFSAQLNLNETEPSSAPASEPTQEETPSWREEAKDQLEAQEEKDELSEWFSQASEQPSKPFIVEPGIAQDSSDWISNLDSSAGSSGDSAPQKEEEDLSWLHDLEASAKQSAETSTPQQDLGWMPDSASTQPSSQEDLNWLNDLGGMPEPSQPAEPSAPQEDMRWLDNLGGPSEPSQPAPEQTSPLQEDLSWLNNLTSISEPSQQEPAKTSPQEDLGWLDDLGEAAQPSPPSGELSLPDEVESVPAQPPAAQEDLSWLNDLAKTSESSQGESAQPSAQEDLSWLEDIQKSSEAPDASSPIFSPRQTAPLGEETESESVPEWLKSATEEPSMPPLGAGALDWFASHDQEKVQLPATQGLPAEAIPSSSEETPSVSVDQTQVSPVSTESDPFKPPSESSPGSSQDVDSLFSIDMPDWLSQPESGASDASLQGAEVASAEGGDSLAPVELPSWVQAMRPVEAVISETTPGIEDQPAEREGPLAGLRGIIPIAPIGSSRRPKAISLKLQATNEQQTSAALLEQMLAAETGPRPFVSPSPDMPQRVLRWVLTGLILVVLSAMIGLGSQNMPVSAALPVEVSAVSNAIVNMAENTPVLVVVDYEPSLAGEMEAVSGPLLDHMVLLRHPNLLFLSTSPNGSALVERLMTNTRINKPAPEGRDYQPGEQYFNLGYLPGGSAGVLAFIESPQTAIPAANVENFSHYTAVIVLTDRAESGRVWVEQLDARKRNDPALASQSLLIVSSAQAGPLLQPYVSSRQVTGMISGLSDAARYEFVNNVPPGNARTYWDAFGVGLLLAIILITSGSLWSLVTKIRPRSAGAEQG